MILRFSGLSIRDHVELLATRLANNYDRWNCDVCVTKMSEDARASYGCKKPGPSAFPLGGKYGMSLCPGNFNDEGAQAIFEMYNLFKQGHLPEKGTIMDQGAWIMEAFAVVSTMDHDEGIERDKIAKANAKRG